uniref:Thioredoxin domain-containing protein n=1 Tax=Timspurckia oligopyrenoides TaxID=708627 RepID=A0A7S0ZEQ0_9RHOD
MIARGVVKCGLSLFQSGRNRVVVSRRLSNGTTAGEGSSTGSKSIKDANSVKESIKKPESKATSETSTAEPKVQSEFQTRYIPEKGSAWDRFKGGSLSWPALVAFAGVGCVLLGSYSYQKAKKTEEMRRTHTKTVGGKAKVGGDWELVNMKGETRKNSDYHGKFVLIYFGFTFCPDICPDELEKISEALSGLGENAKYIQPLFISIDPERDTEERVREYLSEFHPSFEGLTGTVEQCKAAAKLFRVYFSKDNTVGDDYLVDHSIITYLMDPTGEFLEFYGKAVTASDMCLRLSKLIQNYKTQLEEHNRTINA